MKIEVIEAALASLTKLGGRPVATLSELAEKTGIPYPTLSFWRRRGWLGVAAGNLVYADTLEGAINQKRYGGSFPARRKNKGGVEA